MFHSISTKITTKIIPENSFILSRMSYAFVPFRLPLRHKSSRVSLPSALRQQEFSKTLNNHQKVDWPASMMASLDGLPIELKVLVLEYSPDVNSLYALVQASPDFHQAYLSHRQHVLFQVLCNDIMSPTALIDARAVASASAIGRDDGWLHDAEQFLKAYKKERDEANVTPPKPENFTLDDLMSISCLQMDVSIAVEDFCRLTLRKHPMEGPSVCLDDLTANECRRLHRAFYRYEIFVRMFHDLDGNPHHPSGWRQPLGRTLAEFFFSDFEPWEVEEIHCIRDYIFRLYDNIYRQCKSQLPDLYFALENDLSSKADTREDVISRMVPQSKQFYPLAWNPLALEDIYYFRHMTEVLLAQGIELVAYSAGGVPDNENTAEEQLLQFEQHLGNGRFDDLFPEFLSTALEADTRRHRHTWSDEMVQRLDDMVEINDSDAREPNSAWLWFYKGGNLPYNSDFDPKRYLRAWGYVMWDQSRIQRLDLLQPQPRDCVAHGPLLWEGPLLSDRGPFGRGPV